MKCCYCDIVYSREWFVRQEILFIDIHLFRLGRIEFEEFVDVVADSYFKKFSRTEIYEAFRRFDLNHDGYIEAHELKSIFAQLGREFSSDEVDYIFIVITCTNTFMLCLV